jgi:hypothetical protein
VKNPIIRGIIQRRILANYRVDPVVLERLLPAPFRPKLANGFGIAGICLIGLQDIRPRFIPSFLGITSENAAHRIAVEWIDQGQRKEGVYIARRDTNSWINVLAGGRIFPSLHYYASFTVQESENIVHVAFKSADDLTRASVTGYITSELPSSSVFPSLDVASTFFARGSLGYSVTRHPYRFDGLELHSSRWQVEPLAVEHIESSFFDDQARFPAASIEFDCALLMQNIPHEWHARDQLCVL